MSKTKRTDLPRAVIAEPGKPVQISMPVDHLDQAVADTAVALVRTPVTVAKRVAPVAHGLPVYLGLGGLAVIGAVEWPLAAAAGVGFAALRRWGPLRDGAPGVPATGAHG